MIDTAIVSLEGVNLRSGLVVREMSIYFPRHGSFRHYFFEAPHLELTYGDRQTDRYYRNILGGIGLETPIPGALRPRCVEEILQSLSRHYIYICGNVGYQYIRSILPYSRITDVQRVSAFTYPNSLEAAGCGVACHAPRRCSLSKLIVLRDFCINNFN